MYLAFSISILLLLTHKVVVLLPVEHAVLVSVSSIKGSFLLGRTFRLIGWIRAISGDLCYVLLGLLGTPGIYKLSKFLNVFHLVNLSLSF